MKNSIGFKESLFLRLSWIAFIFYVAMVFVNLFMEVGQFHEVILLAGTVISGLILLLAKFYGVYLYFVFYLLVSGTLSGLWFTNAGYTGSIPYYLAAPVVISCLFWRGKKRILLVGLVIADVVVLATVQYLHPEVVYYYNTEFGRYVDVIAGIVSSLIIVAVGVTVAIEAFYKEKKMVEEQNVELSLKAITDPLTGLYNRLYLFERLKEAMVRSKKYGYPLSIVIFDLDCFKSINDTYGHLVGDFVLKKVSFILKNSVRSSDVVGRYGGEEFLMILENTSLDDAHRVAEKVKKAVSKARLPEGLDSLTISAGVAAYSGSEDMDGLIKRADMALYRAKALGKNRVEKAESP